MPSSTSSSDARPLSSRLSWRKAASFVLGFLLALEGVTRLDQAWRYGAPIWGTYSYDSALFEYDEHGIRGRPGGVYEKWKLNALGFRGPEAELRPDPDRIRVVTLGASETFGLYESPGAEWPRALEQELRRRGVPGEVINGAIPGMTPAAQLRHLRHRLLPLSPDVVVWVVHYAAFAGLDPIRLAAQASDRPEPPDGEAWTSALRPRILRRMQEALLPRLPTPIREGVDSVRVQLKLTRRRAAMGDAFRGLTEVRDSERAAFEFFLGRIQRELEAVGAALVVVLPPRRLDERSLRLQYLSFPQVDREWLEAAFPDFAERAAMAGAPPGLDGSRRDRAPRIADLRRLFGSDVEEFMMDAVHFNDAGALAFARAIAPCVVSPSCRWEDHPTDEGGDERARSEEPHDDSSDSGRADQ